MRYPPFITAEYAVEASAGDGQRDGALDVGLLSAAIQVLHGKLIGQAAHRHADVTIQTMTPFRK